MLAGRIDDCVESGAGTVEALGLLPVSVEFTPSKALGRPVVHAKGMVVTGYEIHHGQVTVRGQAEPFPGGCRSGAVWGTSWHGTLENNEFRRAFLTEIAVMAGRDYRPAPGTDFAAVREARLDRLADLIMRHLDTTALSRLITAGPPASMPLIPPAGT
jgi:adenosylcobyric acid synthase